MITNRDKKMIKHALEVSNQSDFHKYHIGCVVAYKNKILNASYNTKKTHPIQKKFNTVRYKMDSTPHCMHAEIHAISPIMNNDIDWKNVTVYIARKRNEDGKNGMARPCATCMKVMKELGIRNIVYTTDFGIAHKVIDE